MANRVIESGRLVKDVDFRTVGENSVARFTVAVDRKYKKDGEQTADFISCVAWGKTAEFINKYFQKGSGIYLEGRLQTGSYTDKDGKKVYTTDVVVEQVEFPIGGKSNGTSADANKEESGGFQDVAASIDEEIPFR